MSSRSRRAIVAASAKDAPAREQRQQMIAAAEAGTLKPEDYLSLSAIVGELKNIGARLERTASAAESGGQYPVAVSAATVQIRLSEHKSRLAGHQAARRSARTALNRCNFPSL